jgi:Holliday junction resolvase-like predicted endonuclease
MVENFLEELAAEYYEFNGYWIKKNTRYEREEFDVFAMKKDEFIHVECDGSSDTVEVIRKRLLGKFKRANKHYEQLFGLKDVQKVKKIAIVGRTNKEFKIGSGITRKSIPEFVTETIDFVAKQPKTVPEQYGFLRMLQFEMQYRNLKGEEEKK